MENIVRDLINAKQIYIYGAGILGRRVFGLLTSYDLRLKVRGYVVTDGSPYVDDPGIPPVFGVDRIDRDAFIVVALVPKYHAEVSNTLKEKGFQKYVFWNGQLMDELWKQCTFSFIDRKKDFSKVCFVLAGYKDFLWDDIFKRLKRFCPADVEVCILCSGKREKRLEGIAEANGWSILSTNRNNVGLIQNIAVAVYEKAEWFYKMDEDIFLTERCFEKLLMTYQCRKPYKVGCVAPLIPVNASGYRIILERTGALEQFENRFEEAGYGVTTYRKIEWDPQAAEFMWGYQSPLPRLDRLNELFSESSVHYCACGVRFSIGFILYHRSFWANMGGLPVTGNVDMGVDEVTICGYCMTSSSALIVAENTVVGHFSFGRQTEKMKELYKTHHELFALPGEE